MQAFYKTIRYILFAILGTLVLLFVAGFFADSIFKNILLSQVKKAGEGQYRLELQEADISFLPGNILLKEIRFSTDSSGGYSGPLVLAEIGQLSVEGISWLSYLLDEKLLIERLRLDGADVELKLFNQHKDREGGDPFQLGEPGFYSAIQEQLDKLRLRDLSLNQFYFSMVNISTRDTLKLSTGQLDLHSSDILLDAGKFFSDNRAFYAHQIDFDGQQLELKRSGNKDWRAKAAKLEIDTREDMLYVAAGELLYVSKTIKADTLSYLSLDDFQLEGLDLSRLEVTKIAVLESLEIEGLNLQKETLPAFQKAEKASSPSLALADLSLGDWLPPFMEKVELGNLKIRQVDLKLEDQLLVEGLALRANDILLDSSSAFAENRFLHAREMEAQLDGILVEGEEPAPLFELENFALEAREGIANLHVGELRIEPSGKLRKRPWIQAELEGIQILSLNTSELPDGMLSMDSLILQRPKLKARLNLPAADPSEANEPVDLSNLDIFPALNRILEEIRLNQLLVDQLALELAINRGEESYSFSINKLDVQTQDILLGPGNVLQDSRIFYAGQMEWEGQQLELKSKGKESWLARMDRLKLKSQEDKLSIGADELYYFEEGESKDPPAFFSLEKMLLENLDVEKLVNAKIASLESLALHELKFMDQDSLSAFSKGNKEVFRLASFSLSRELPPFMQRLELGELLLDGIHLDISHQLELSGAGLEARDLVLDREKAFADQRFLHARELIAEADVLQWEMEAAEHAIEVEGIVIKAKNGIAQLKIGALLVAPEKEWEEKAWLKADLKNLLIPSIDTRQLISGALVVDSLLLQQPEVVWYQPDEQEKEQQDSGLDLYPLIENQLQSFKLNNLSLINGDVRIGGLGTYYGLHIPHFSIEMQDFYLDSLSARDPERFLHAGEIQGHIQDLLYLFPDRVYSFQLEEGSFSTAQQSLELLGMRYAYSPNYKQILAAEEKNEVYLIQNDRLLAKGMHWEKLLQEEAFIVSTLISEGLYVYVYKDFNQPEREEIKPMPQDMVLNMGSAVAVDELIVKDASITYEEMKEGASLAGLVDIEQMGVELRNLTNIPARLREDPYMYVHASGQLLGKGSFETQIQVPLLEEDNALKISGSMDTLDITALNRIVRYNSRLAIESGTLYEVEWDFEAGRELALGTFEVSYENLSVQLSEAHSPDTTGLLKDVVSELANALVIDSSIAEEKSVEPKKVYFEQPRKKNRSFFHYYVLALMGGFIEAIGIPFQ